MSIGNSVYGSVSNSIYTSGIAEAMVRCNSNLYTPVFDYLFRELRIAVYDVMYTTIYQPAHHFTLELEN